MKYGYVRDSRRTEKFEQMQADALKKHGAEEIIVAETAVDYISMARKLKSGDSLYIKSLDRLNKDYEKAFLTVLYLMEKGVAVYIEGELVNGYDIMIAECEIQHKYEFSQVVKRMMNENQEERNNKKLQRIVKRLEEASFPHKFGGEVQMMILKNKAIEIVEEEGLK
jgi:DNA invertase Pin-like site-specific DNA recombinase